MQGIPIEVIQQVFWPLLEQWLGVNPGDYVDLAGDKVGQAAGVLEKSAEFLRWVETSAQDGVIAWDEVTTGITMVQGIVAAVEELKV